MRKNIIFILIILISLIAFGCSKQSQKEPEISTVQSSSVASSEDVSPKSAQTPPQEDAVVGNEQANIGKPEGYSDMGAASEEEKKAARETFAAFKAAVLAYRGSEVVPLLADNTISFYKLLLAAAQSAIHVPDKYVKMEQDLTISARMNVKVMLERLSVEFIDTATPEELCEVAFNQGWVGYKTLTTASIDSIHAYEREGKRYLTGDFYYAGTIEDKRVIRIGFQQENGVWKVDLMPLFMNIDNSVGMYAFKHGFDLDSSIDYTVKEAEKSLEPAQWQMSIFQKDAFGVKFPRQPLFTQNETEKIYTSSHYKYGQFDVRILLYSKDDTRSPFYLKEARDQDVLAFIKGMGANQPLCRMDKLGEDTVIQCDFEVAEKNSEGTAVWIFTQDRRYLLFNLARKGSFSREAAGEFLDSFSFGLE